MQALVFAKGASGVPSTLFVADLSDKTAEISFVHSALWGPLTARILWGGTIGEGYMAASQWLGNAIEIWSPDAAWLWEGLIWSITFGAGRRTRTRSLEGYANRIRVLWTDVTTGLAGTPKVVNDTDEQAIYGIIEYIHSAGSVFSATADNIATRLLEERTRLLYTPEGGSLGDTGAIELSCFGWYRTLGYQSYTAATGGTADVSTVIQNILTASCPFISTSYGAMETTGDTTGRTYSDYDSALTLIKRLIGQAPGYTFGLSRGRIPYITALSRTSSTVNYLEEADGLITAASGGIVPPWNIRPNSILRQVDFVSGSSGSAEAIAAIESVFLVETEYSSRTNTVSYRAALAGVGGTVEAL